MQNKKVIIFFLHNSVGELYVGLPILWFLSKYLDITIYFLSLDKNILNNMNVQTVYIDIMQEIGILNLGKINSIKLLSKLLIKKNSVIQFSCFSGMTTIEKIYYYLIGNSKKIFFPHSFAMYPHKEILQAEEYKQLLLIKKNEFFKRFGNLNNFLLLNREEEINYYSLRGWDKKKLIGLSPFGYYDQWLELILKETEETEIIKIFVPLRNHNKHALTLENYEYLIDSLIKLFLEFKQFIFFVKFHPRQYNINKYEKKFLALENVQVSTLNPFELAKQCDLTIGLWGSVLQDSIAIGTPAIEFHKHHTSHPQVYKNEKGKIESIYVTCKLIESCENLQCLKSFLNNVNKKNLKSLGVIQKKKLDKIYQLNDSKQIEKLIEFFLQQFMIKSTLKNKIKELYHNLNI